MPAAPDELTRSEYARLVQTSSVYNVARISACDFSPTLSRKTGQNVWIKREDQQSVHSFKIRGAYQRMANLATAAFEAGVIAASAGNHAQGVAKTAQELGTTALIIVPETTPEIKQIAIRNLGAELVLFGDTYDASYAYAKDLAEQTGRTYVHPYDHPDTIVGQGTIGLELSHQVPNAEVVFIPVGGGGLIAGMAIALKQANPHIRIIGVEAEEADAMTQSLRLGERVNLSHVGTFADGCAVKQVGVETFRLAQDLIDEMVTVETDEICAAIKDMFEANRALPEPAGALGLAGLTKWSQQNPHGLNCVAVLSGANINFDRLQFIAERTKTGSGRELILAVQIPEQPGSFVRLCGAIGKRNLTEFNYRFADQEQAIVFAGISITDPQDADDLKRHISAQGFVYSDLTHDETAKNHLRHLVGGRNPHPTPERIFRVDFPERAGALATFLKQLGSRWNISLFHYRNHGADRGRALVGFQVPPETTTTFNDFAQSQPFPMVEETRSAAVQLFL